MRIVLASAAFLLAAAPSAHAAGWQETSVAARTDAAPRTAIASDGTSLTAYRRADGAIFAVAGASRGRFAAPIAVTTREAQSYAVAVAPHGQSTVAYEAKDGIHVAIRSGRGFKDRRVASSSGSEINGIQIAADPLGGWVVAERWFPAKGSGTPYRVRVLSLDAIGRPAGAVQDLGEGEFGIAGRAAKQLTVLDDGRAVLAFEAENGRGVLVSTRPHGAAFSAPAPVGQDLADPAVTKDGNHALVAAVQAGTCGDAGCAGAPVVSSVGPDGAPGAPAGPALDHPTRAFAATAGPGTLAFLLKDAPQPFSRMAPVVAFGGGKLQTLSKTPATEPFALKLFTNTLVLWTTADGLGAAKAGSLDGRFHRIAAPPGPPPTPLHTNATNRDFASAGWYAIAAWSRGSTVRVSMRRF